MPVTVKLNYLRIAPRKVRLVADLIRKKKVEEAQTILNFTIKKATKPILKLLNTAVADAHNNFQLNSENLYISKITVDEGPKYKRWRPRARGSAYEIQKKTSHITLILDEVVFGKKIKKVKKLKKTKKAKKPIVVSKKEKTLKEVKKEEMPKAEKPSKELRSERDSLEQAKFKTRPETEKPKPKTEKGLRKFFRRKSF